MRPAAFRWDEENGSEDASSQHFQLLAYAHPPFQCHRGCHRYAERDGVARRLGKAAFGPYLPVDLTPCCVAALPDADDDPHCSILAMQVTAVRTLLPFVSFNWLSPSAGTLACPKKLAWQPQNLCPASVLRARLRQS